MIINPTLKKIVEKKNNVKVFMSNGFQMNGILLEDETEYIVMRQMGEAEVSLVFKSQISTIQVLA